MTTSIRESMPVQEAKVPKKTSDIKKGEDFQAVLKKTLKTREEAPKDEEEKKESLPGDPLIQSGQPPINMNPEVPEGDAFTLSAVAENLVLPGEIGPSIVEKAVEKAPESVEENPGGKVIPQGLLEARMDDQKGKSLKVTEEGDQRIIQVPRNQDGLHPMKEQTPGDAVDPSGKPKLEIPAPAEEAKIQETTSIPETVDPSEKETLSIKENSSLPVEEETKAADRKPEIQQPMHPEAVRTITEKEETLEPVKTDSGMDLSGRVAEISTETRSLQTAKVEAPADKAAEAHFKENLEMATTKILERVETISEGSRTTMKVKLNPEEMGEMEITLTMEEGKLSGKILLENHDMRQLFSRRMEELSESLKLNSVNVLKFEVGDREAASQGKQQGQQNRSLMNQFKGYRKEERTVESYGRKGLSGTEGVNLLA